MRMMFQSLVAFTIVNICIVTTLVHGSSSNNERKPYIVYMGGLKNPGQTTSVLQRHHHKMLLSAIGDEKLATQSKIHSYGKSFNGFAAKLLPHEVEKLSGEQGVISVFPSIKRKLHTTRSWEFLGLSETKSTRNTRIESDIIVGVLDSGIWIDCPSFNDQDCGPPPKKWKGECVKSVNFTSCNKKVIGARYYNLEGAAGDEEQSPVDNEGHGTHTSSTIVGTPVGNASLYGIARGTARGGVPSSRLAMYKVCWSSACSDLDILAGFDDAIADGVDVISISIGGASRDYFSDPIAIGSFHAMKQGVLTSCSAGNDGPYPATVQNVAPWIFTVGASGIDRKFMTELRLGNGQNFSGIAINTFSMKDRMHPLTDGFHVVNRSTEFYGNASACDYGTISEEKVKGNIVYCEGNNGQDYTIQEYGGIGTIMSLDTLEDTAFTPLIPGTYVLPADGRKIEQYINSTKNPTAVIQKTTTVTIEAPFVASFSSRGPQLISHNILKPDITAPGIDILAAYSKQVSITGYPSDDRKAVFNIISGTSMSCPHVAAAAAYVKSFHPDWSPAAIKSALMTTATPMKIKDKLGALASGAGQVNPSKAIHPGLVYDMKLSSYIQFLCKEGYNSTDIGLIAGGSENYSCSAFKPPLGMDGLNYPTLHFKVNDPYSPFSETFYRTVTHVEERAAVYEANVVSPDGLSVKIEPRSLNFTQPQQKQTFKIVVEAGRMPKETSVMSALLEWNNDAHNVTVRSPILVYNSNLLF